MFALYDFFIYCLITAYTPGINNLLSMSNAMRLGLRRSIPFLLGILAGFFAVMTVCAFFSTTLFTYLPIIQLPIQICGAGYMIYLAWKTWKSSGNVQTDTRQETGFLSGMILQFVNPKIYIYAITAMSLYILPVYSSRSSLAAFTLLLTAIGASGSLAWALCGSAFCRFLSKHTKMVNSVMALLLVYCAIALFL